MNRLLAITGLAMISFPVAAVSPEGVVDAPPALALLGIGIVIAVGIARYMNR